MNSLIKTEAYENDKQLKELKKSINGGFLEIARLLYENKKNKYFQELDYETFESYIAQEELGFDRSNVYRLVQIYEKFILELNVAPGRLILIDWTKLRELLPIVNKDNQEGWIDKAINLSRSDLIAEIREDKPLPTPEIPKGKYQTIVIDPPWPIHFIEREVREGQKIDYPIMDIESIKSFPVPDLATDNCHLFLWTTHKFLPISFEILKSWGFDYHACFTWNKLGGMTLFGINRRTEFVLYAHKGSLETKTGKAIPTYFEEKSREHSRKPDIFYNLISELYPEPRIDIFSREKREGFDQYGNEPGRF